MQRMTGFEVTRKKDNGLEKVILPAILKIQVIQSLHNYICIKFINTHS